MKEQLHKKDIQYIRNMLIRHSMYFILFSLLVVMTYIPIYSYVYNNALNNIIESCSNIFDKNITTLDSSLTALRMAVNGTYTDPKFNNLKYNRKEENPIIITSLPDTLKYILINQPLLGDAAILLPNKTIVSRTRFFNTNEYFDYYPQFLSCEDLTYDEWIDMLYQQRFLPAMDYYSVDYGSYSAITYSAYWFYSEHGNVYTSDKLFFATLPIPSLEKMFLADMGADSWIYISDASGTLLYASDYYQKKGYEILSATTNQHGLNIQVGISDAFIKENMRPVRMMFYLFGGSILLLLAITTVWVTSRTSRPLYSVLNAIFASTHIRQFYKTETDHIPHYSGNYTAIAHSLQAVDLQLEEYCQLIDQQQEQLRHQVLNSALQNGLYTPEGQTQFQRHFPNFPENYQLAVITYNIQGAPTATGEACLQWQNVNGIRNYLQRYPETVIVHAISSNIFLLVLPVTRDADWDQRLVNLCKALDSSKEICRCQISAVYQSPQKLVLAYQNLFHQLSSPETAPSVCDESEITALPLSMSLLQIIYAALSNGNYTMATSALKKCVDGFPEGQNIMLIQHTYNMLMRMLVQLKLENPTLLFSVELPLLQCPDQAELLLDHFLPCFRIICDYMQVKLKPESKSVTSEILSYIEENLGDCSLCIDKLKDIFGVSSSTLQKLVKDATSLSVSAYIEQLRLTMAYNLLREKVPVQEVAQRCGFSSHNSFFKAFKRFYGLAPSQIDKLSGSP